MKAFPCDVCVGEPCGLPRGMTQGVTLGGDSLHIPYLVGGPEGLPCYIEAWERP